MRLNKLIDMKYLQLCLEHGMFYAIIVVISVKNEDFALTSPSHSCPDTFLFLPSYQYNQLQFVFKLGFSMYYLTL